MKGFRKDNHVYLVTLSLHSYSRTILCMYMATAGTYLYFEPNHRKSLLIYAVCTIQIKDIE